MITASSNRPARQRLLAAATRLFYTHGISRTGIDSITAQAGVAKMSLYNNFASKDDLMLAYIQARHEELLQLYRDRLANSSNAMQRNLAMFDAYIDHASMGYDGGFRGCGLLNAAAELPAGHSGRTAVKVHKEQVEALMREQLAEAGFDTPEDTSAHLALLLEGAMSRAGLDGTTTYLRQARRIAQTLLEQA